MNDARRIRVPLGEGEIEANVPEGWNVRTVIPRGVPPLPSLESAIEHALAEPVAGPTLRKAAAAVVARCVEEGRRPRIAIAVTDSTRTCPDDRLLPPLLDELRAGGVEDADVTVLVATGLHRASTVDEKAQMLGRAIIERVRVVDHDAVDPAGLVDLGSVEGTMPEAGEPGPIAEPVWPAVVNRTAVEADLLIATGIVEPHQYAGFSGGYKTVAIGLAGESTIAATHRPATLEHPGVRLGRIEGNPFAAAVRAIGRRARVAFVLDLAADQEDRPIAVEAGQPDAVHDHLARVVARASGVEFTRQADVAIAGVGAPKDANLYQASRGVTYLHFAPLAAVRPGGIYVLPAAIPEGAGEGLGERRFAAALEAAVNEDSDGSWPWRLAEKLRRGSQPGEQRAFMVAKVLQDARIIVVGATKPDVVRACGLLASPTLDDALELAGSLAREARPEVQRRALDLLVVPHAIRTLLVSP